MSSKQALIIWIIAFIFFTQVIIYISPNFLYIGRELKTIVDLSFQYVSATQTPSMIIDERYSLDKKCEDFENRKDAVISFNLGNKNLDNDGDLIPCESMIE